MARKKAEIDDVPMDLTPMIDVVFLLLIFFIVTIKFKVLEGKLETELPKDVGVNAGEVLELLEKLEIDIKPDPSGEWGIKVQINGISIPNLATLESRLREYKRVNPEQKATLYPNEKINYEQVVKVVDRCLAADVTDITFAGVRFDA